MSINTKLAERPPKSGKRNAIADGLNKETFADFSQVLSHRIGSLLSSIEGYTDLILSSLDGREDRENAFRILEGSARIGGILSDLSHYQESLSLNRHIRQANKIGPDLLLLMSDRDLERLEVQSHLPEDILVDVDERLIRQALHSVLRNAFEVTASDKLSVSLSIDTTKNNSIVRFKIYSPIPLTEKRIRTQLFQPFFTTKAANLGLGLTMARRILRAHAGDIRLTSSAMEAGTEFTCSIPRAER